MIARRSLKYVVIRNGNRCGLSVLEFVGCTMALVGGIWLGAVYLGIDVRQVAQFALSESELMNRMPESWRPANPASESAPTPGELAASVQEELVALRHEIAVFRAAPPHASTEIMGEAAGNDAITADGAADAEDLTKAATVEYWARLHDIVQNGSALQRDAESAATESNATKLAALKGRISRFTASNIRALPNQNVDSAAASLGKELAGWYEDDAGLYDEVVQIWEATAGGQSGSEITTKWEQGQIQHHNEGQLLTGRVAGVRESLVRRFGDGFVRFSGL